jgi:hypothetical protein
MGGRNFLEHFRETRQSRASLIITNTRRLSLFASVIASLFAVRMLVAPLPVVPLIPGSLVVVRTVLSMMLHQVTPVSTILTVIPIMVIAMITIIDSHLNARFLR